MRCNVDIDWCMERIYSPPESAEKGELIDKLGKIWKNSTGGSNIPNKRRPYKALELLFDKYPEDFMMIILVTMREREVLKQARQVNDGPYKYVTVKDSKGGEPGLKTMCSERELPPSGNREDLVRRLKKLDAKEVGKTVDELYPRQMRLDLTAGGLNGLGSLINHWSEQQRDASELDVVGEFIGSRQELRIPEYMIGAIVEQIRRIRRGMIPGKNTHLEFTDGLLTLARDLLNEIDERGKSNVSDYNVYPNDQLHLLVEFQRILNLAKRPQLVTELGDAIDSFRKDLANAGPLFTKDIFDWWAIRVWLRSEIRCMMPDHAKKWEDRRKTLENSMSENKQKYVADLRERNKGTLMRSLTTEMQPLGESHEGLAEFLNNPSLTLSKGTRKDKRDLQLDASIAAVKKKMRKDSRLFVKHKTIPVKKKGTKSKTCLIDYLYNSITNAEFASQLVISNNHYLAPVMLVRVAALLVVKFRWFTAPRQAAVYGGYQNKQPAAMSIKSSENLREAKRLRKELIGVLENILRRLRLVLPQRDNSPPIRLMEGWISTLNNLDLKEKKTIRIAGKNNHLAALGQLSHTCGDFVNWPWGNPWPGGGTAGRGRVVPNESLALELFESGGAAKPTVTISNDKDNHYLYYPYVIPVTTPTKNPPL